MFLNNNQIQKGHVNIIENIKKELDEFIKRNTIVQFLEIIGE